MLKSLSLSTLMTREKNLKWIQAGAPYALALAAGLLVAWRMTAIPSRLELCVYLLAGILIPGLKFPRAAFYYIVIVSCFIPVLRRVYYILNGRPEIDYFMLITDGAVVAMFFSIVMNWVKNKTRFRDYFSLAVFGFMGLMLVKIVFLNQGSTLDALYAFKFYGLYICIYFAGTTLFDGHRDFFKFFSVYSTVLLLTALYSLKQILFGFFSFEELWIQSVEFTTLAIEGQIRTFSTFISPASLSDAMTILFAIGCFFFLQKNFSSKIRGILLIAAAAPPLLFASVRSNWLACILGFWLMFFLLRSPNKKSILLNIIVIPFFIFFLINSKDVESDRATAAMQKTASQSQATTEIMITSRTEALVNPLEEDSFQKRVATWVEIMMEVFYYHPLGKGLGTTGYAHSFYFQVLGEMGYLGLLLYLFILTVILLRGLKLAYYAPNPEVKTLSTVFLVVFIMINTLNITGVHLNSHPADLIYWLSCGAITFLYRKHILLLKQTKLGNPLEKNNIGHRTPAGG